MVLTSTRRYLLSILAVLVLSAGLAIFSTDSASAKANGRVIAVTGVSTVDGEQVIVHIIAEVTAGKSDQQIAAAALAGVGARGLKKSEYVLLGNTWDQFADTDGGNDYVTQRYNSKKEAAGGFDAIAASRLTWNAADSVFAFLGPMENTSDCPSLVNECKGSQYFDGNNDIGWLGLRDRNTLAVTWSGTSTDESDVAFNTRYTWSTDEAGSAIDIETVALHEFGHVAGLGHSVVDGSIMEAIYDGVRRELTADDIAGLQAMYDGDNGSGDDPTVTPIPDPSPTPVPGGDLHVGIAAYSDGDGVAFSTSGKKGRDLIITVVIQSGTATVDGVSVSLRATHEGGWSGTGSATTNSSGEARFRVRNASSGDWSATVLSAEKGSQSCSTNCPDGPHSYTKP